MSLLISALTLCVNAVDNSVTTLNSSTLTVMGLKSNTSYYIMDISFKKYINIYSASTSATTGVIGRNRNTNVDLAKWTLSFTSDGYVQFIDPYNRALSINSSNGTYGDTNTGASNQKFIVVRRTSVDNYQGLYLIKYGNLYLTMSSTGAISLSNSLDDATYWSICKSEKGSSILYDYSNIEPQTIYGASNYNSAISNLGYTHSEITDASAAKVYTRFRTSTDLLCIATHGLYDSNGNALAGISIDTGSSERLIFAHSNLSDLFPSHVSYSINNLSNNVMSSYRCIFFIGCSTGISYVYNGTMYNLLQSAIDKGCHCAVGTTEAITLNELSQFYSLLSNYCDPNSSTDYSISEIMNWIDHLSSSAFSASNGFPYVIYGDRYQYLEFD